MKNIGQYNQDLSVPRKKDIDSLETRVKTNEDNIAMAESDIEDLNTDVGTLKTDVSNVKTALGSKQDTIVGAASTIVEDNLTAGKVLVSDASGKVGADASISNVSDVITMNKRLIAQYSILCTNNEKIVELDTDTFSYPAVRFGQNASTKAIKIFGEVEDKVVEFSTESEDFVTLRGVADATEKSDAVNLSQLNEVKNSITPSINENLLVNGYLLDPINTIGSWNLNLSNTIRAICNGWTAAVGSNTTINLNRKNGGVVINSMIDATSFYNVTGNINIKLGKTYTFSVLKKVISDDGVSITSTFTTTATTSSSHDNGLYTITFTAENNTGYVGIDIPATVEVTIYGAKLEEGSIQTLCYKDSSGNWVQHIPNKADEFARCSQWNSNNTYIGNALLPLSGGTMTGPINMRGQKITRLADGTDDADAATVKQVKAGAPKGPVMVMISNVTLGAAKEVIHNNLWDCTFLGTITGTSYIDGVAVQVYPQSYIVSVGGSDYAKGGGYCAIQKSMNSMSVVIKMLCSSSTAPRSIQIPCLVW